MILSHICDDCLYCRVILKYLMSCTIKQPQHVEGLDREDKAVSQSGDANLEIILTLVAAAHAPTTATVLSSVVEMIPSNGPLAGQGKKWGKMEHRRILWRVMLKKCSSLIGHYVWNGNVFFETGTWSGETWSPALRLPPQSEQTCLTNEM